MAETISSRYLVVEELGRGEWGRVLLVEDLLRPGRRLALKTMRLDPGETEVGPGGLASEFRALTRVRHPSLARVYDLGLAHEPLTGAAGLYFTREYVDGVDLVSALRDAPAAAVSRSAAILAHALATIHAHGVVHGDLAPGNVLGKPGEPESLRIIDFGLSVIAGMRESYSSGVQGSVYYVAPEMLRGSDVGPQTDLYALGALLYHAAAGKPPFTGSVGEVIQAHLDVTPEPLGSVRKDLGVDLVSVVGRLLAKDPAHRYASALDVLRDLEGMAPEPVRPVPEAPLVGRDALVDEVEGLAREGSEASVVLLEGEDGAGKSRFLEAVRWRLQLGERVSVVDVAFGGEPDPLAGVRELVSHLGLVSGRSKEADSILGALAGRVMRPGFRDEVASFTTGAMASAPAVVMIDDLDAASVPAREIVAHVMRALDMEAGPPPVVITSHPGGAGEAFVADLERAHRLELGGLDAAASEKLVEALAGESVPGLAQRITKHAGLLPGHIEEVARALLARGRDEDIAALPVPSGLEAAVLDRMERLDGEDVVLLDVVAAGHGPCGWEEAAEHVPFEEVEEFVEAARRLCAAGFLVEVDQGRFDFEKSGVREAVYGASPAKLRRAVHAGVHERLAPGGAMPEGSDLTVAAFHAVRAVPEGRKAERAAALAIAAASCLVESNAAAAAARLLGAALGVAPAKRIGEVRTALASAYTTTGEFDEALELLDEEASRLAGRDRAGPLVQAAGIMVRKGAYEEAAGMLERTLGLDLDGTMRGEVLETLARIHVMRGRYEEAASAADKALALGPEGSLEARVMVAAGIAASYLGNHEQALETLERARGLARRSGDAAAEDMAVGHLAIARGRSGDVRGSLEMFEVAVRLAEKGGDLGRLPAHLMNLGTAHHSLGEVGRAVELYRRAARHARRMGNTSVVVAALVNLADRYAYIGAADEGREAARRAIDLARRKGMSAFEARGHLALADCAVCDTPSMGLEDARRAVDLFEDLGLDRYEDEAGVVEAELLLWGGDADGARERVERVLDKKGLDEDIEVKASLILGECLVALREAGRAREVLGKIVEAKDNEPEYRWRALAGLAALHKRDGEDRSSRELARQALDVLGEIEAQVPQEHREPFMDRHPARRALVRLSRAGEQAAGAEERIIRLMEVNRAVIAERDPRKLLALTLDTAVDLCGAERGFLITIGPKGAVHVEVARNLDREMVRSAKLKVSRSIAEKVAQTGTPILTVNAQEDDRFERFESVRDLRLRSVMCVPIRGRDRILGTLYLDNRFQPGRFNEADMRLLLAFADVVAVALENARLMEENEKKTAELLSAKTGLEAATRKQARRLETALKELEATREALGLKYDYSRIVGQSPAMFKVFQTLDRIIDTQVPVLVHGESGTGKELIARAIHYNGPRREGPFVSINCGAVPETLMESELFGHVKGAFTGATTDSEGLLAAAHRGTLFLDEIGDMSPAMQTKLLRALQEGEFRPVGSSEDRRVDVRVLAASHRDLAREVKAGSFREDLYYRINVVTIRIPPLRERLEDLPLLADHILEQFAGEIGGSRKRISAEALDVLLGHSWPGNVRELENVLKNAAILSRDDELSPGDIHLAPDSAATGAPPSTLNLEELERQAIQRVLELTGGNKRRAAEILGIARPTLYRKLKEIDGESEKE